MARPAAGGNWVAHSPGCGILSRMSTTLTVDGYGNLLLPASLTQMAHLSGGAQVSAEVVGGQIILQAMEDAGKKAPEPEAARLVRKGRRLVVAGVKAFDAAASLKADREERDDQLARIVSGQ